jgi:hypothetical protein
VNRVERVLRENGVVTFDVLEVSRYRTPLKLIICSKTILGRSGELAVATNYTISARDASLPSLTIYPDLKQIALKLLMTLSAAHCQANQVE